MERIAGRSLGGATIALILLALLTASAGAASIPLSLHRLAPVHAFIEPTDLASDPAHPNRLFVTERSGRIYLLENGQASEFADLSSLVLDRTSAGEEAMYSIALAPDFDQTGHLYVGYSSNSGDVKVDELTASGDSASLASRRTVITIPHPDLFHHFMGRVVFGPDGYLYISTGDGYKIDAPPFSIPGVQAMWLNDLRGKILRIAPSDPPGAAEYSIPSDNPYVSDGNPVDTRDEIWSYGFRNPYRITFDRTNGDLMIGDVGQEINEEIDFAPSPSPGVVGGKGLYYGWPCREGLDPAFVGKPFCAAPPVYTDPIFTYLHPDPPDGSGCSAIVGGFVVRDHNLGDLYGRYLYGDYCGGKVRSLRPSNSAATDRAEPEIGPRPFYDLNSFGEDALGRIYVIAAVEGTVFRVEPSSAFSFRRLDLNKRRGTARLTAHAPDAGKFVLSGAGLRTSRTSARKAGNLPLPVVPNAKIKRKLGKSGKAALTAVVTFTPNGGTPRTKNRRLTLMQKP